ncbi:MAG TPA: cation:proton antiporter [Acidimicrobiales bacterium]|nr:cation:proton antiporter [Acidimicrobiales bacterium]
MAADHALNVTALSVVAACVVLWGLVSARLERWQVTAPIAFVLLGLVVTHGPFALTHLQLHSSTIRSVAEITLALVLFADASRVNARALRADVGIPVRLLGIGLPLAIGAGAAVAAALFTSGGIWVAATVGAIVAPTDAALGASIMSDRRVPARVRRVLNVESGLNDGIATPFVNLFLAGALATESISGGGVGKAAVDLVGGAAIGAGVGLAGALLLALATQRGWSAPGFRPLAVLALAVFAYAVALVAHTNGFVAAFVGGLAFGTVLGAREDELAFGEEVGTLLSLLVWFAFGAVMLVPGLQAAGWRDLLFAVLALTVVRMVPVAVALTGSGLDRATVAFVGWFGPRGLASVVFGLIAVDSLAPADAKVVLGAVVVTVALSVLAHGVSASPLARRYGVHVRGLHAERPEHQGAPGLPLRTLKVERRATAGTGRP